MFALGVTMYQMLTGVHPFWKRGDSSETFYSNVTSASPPKPSEIVSGVSESLDEIILRLLGKAPHLRYRKCDQLINAMKKVEVQ
jgi:serine/threonine-protein kinase